MKYLYTFLIFTSVVHSSFAYASPVDSLLSEYRQQDATSFSAEAGKQLWLKSFPDKKTGKNRDCTNCHTSDLKNTGKHIKTGKLIKPMSPSVNPQRLTDIKKINKWFKRNCKWTIGRECTVQEKGNILLYLQSQ